MLDVSIITFVVGIMVVGFLLTAAIRRDFAYRRRVERDLRRQAERLQSRRQRAARD
jgi:type II secretory pathway pseudopilin PulG